MLLLHSCVCVFFLFFHRQSKMTFDSRNNTDISMMMSHTLVFTFHVYCTFSFLQTNQQWK